MSEIKLPETGFLRLRHIIGNAKVGVPALYPVSSATWWRGIKTGRYPAPFRLGPNSVGWRVEDIRKLIAETRAASEPTSLAMGRPRGRQRA